MASFFGSFSFSKRRVGKGAKRRAHALLTKASEQFARLPRPVTRQYTLRNQAMETAERPVGDATHQPVLHRVVMDVIDVPFEIRVVADGVLPIAALPDALSRFAILLMDRVFAAGRPREKLDFKRLQRAA